MHVDELRKQKHLSSLGPDHDQGQRAGTGHDIPTIGSIPAEYYLPRKKS